MLTCTLALAWVLAPGAQPSQAPSRFYVAGASASALVDDGLAKVAPTGEEAAQFQTLPAPGVRLVPTVARATNVPWIDTNAYRYRRGLRKANYAQLPAGSATLAAAEAFAFGAEAILNPDPAEIEDLRTMLRFLQAQERPPLPPLVNIGVMDDGSPRMSEVLKMLSRRNLLYRVVSTPDPALDLNVQLGTSDFPTKAAGNPYEFAVLVREKLGDEKRLVRLYGTSTVLAHLTGDGNRARLFLLQYGRGRGRRSTTSANPQAMQVRVLGAYQPTGLAAYGSQPGASLSDIQHPDGATEFWVPDFSVCAIVDLEARK
jgi:hypothetical protein